MTAPTLVGLCGYQRSGKDTAAQVLIQQGWQHLAFADALRDFTAELDPWVCDTNGLDPRRLHDLLKAHGGWEQLKSTPHGPESRRLLVRLGQQVRGIDPDAWVTPVVRAIDIDAPGSVITDVRFANEADAIHRVGGAVVQVWRPGVESNGDPSETIDFPVDAVVANEGSMDNLHEALLRTLELL